MIKVKICGINSTDAFDACVDWGVDWVGFNFYPPSPRSVTPAEAASLSARSRMGPKRVGLFVKPTDEQIEAALSTLKLDILQIYDDPVRVAALGACFEIPVWRAVGIASRHDLPTEPGGADGFVVEAPPVTGGLPGGNARMFDWTMLTDWRAPSPWLLAGGLHAANVQQAVALTGATAVDVSSGVETSPGNKSPELIRAFVAAARTSSTGK